MRCARVTLTRDVNRLALEVELYKSVIEIGESHDGRTLD